MIYQEILLELDVKELKFEFVPKTLLFSHDNLQTKLDNGNIVLINKKIHKKFLYSKDLVLTLNTIYSNGRRLYVIEESITLIKNEIDE